MIHVTENNFKCALHTQAAAISHVYSAYSHHSQQNPPNQKPKSGHSYNLLLCQGKRDAKAVRSNRYQVLVQRQHKSARMVGDE